MAGTSTFHSSSRHNFVASMSTKQSPASSPSLTHEDRIAIVRNHFEQKGYRAHSGLQFGCELVLYADSPGKVHSDFCVHVPDGADGQLDWRTIQTLVRSMPDLRKTLIIAHVREVDPAGGGKGQVKVRTDESNDNSKGTQQALNRYVVEELAIATEHAPFRHKNIPQGVGTQVKPQRKS